MARKKFNELRKALMSKPGAEQRAQSAKDRLDEEIKRYVMTLSELRKAREVTQVELARALSSSQPEVSRIENQGDVFLSTARSYIEALGGELSLIARFPDDPEIEVSIGDLTDQAATEEVS